MTNELHLNPLWEQLGAKFQEHAGWRVPQSFGDDLQELETVTRAAGLMDVSSRSRIRVSGADRIEFLNNILTNDIKALEAGRGCRACLLTPQGKVILDINVFAFKEFVLLEAEPGLEEKIIQTLRKYLITEEVSLDAATSHFTALLITGKEAHAVLIALFSELKAPEETYHFTQTKFEGGEVACFRRPPLGQPCYELLVSTEFGASVAEKLLNPARQVFPFGETVYEALRISSGILRYGMDIDETTLLSETGLEETAASETKGCYPGQEVVAKIKTYDGLKRKICKLVIRDTQPPKASDTIYSAEGKEIGRITSASILKQPYVALGYVAKAYVKSDEILVHVGKDRISAVTCGV